MLYQSHELAVRGNRLLKFYAIYSLMVSIIVVTISFMDTDGRILGNHAPSLRLFVTISYLVIAAMFAVISQFNPNVQHATAYFFLETAILSTFMMGAGGLATGFSSLILFSVVIANLLAPGVLGYGVAAWVSLAVLVTVHYLPDRYDGTTMFASGFYGGLCFLLAALTQALSNRLNSALELANEQSTRLRRLRRFSWQALLDLPNGIVACDRHCQIIMFNQKAQLLLQLKDNNRLPAELEAALEQSDELRLDLYGESLAIRKVALKDADNGDFLLYIEEQAALNAAAQQLKLASLGRLTASIAHEIRNPLSALRQASQLLAETPYLQAGEQYLTQVVEQNCMRINRIIEDILQLSRKRQPLQEGLRLKPWLDHFARQFQTLHSDQNFDLDIQCEDSLIMYFDPDHLQQVLHNLCGNGLRYALRNAATQARLELHASRCGQRLQLDISDNGGGISAEQAEHLFEPFFTTEHNGTGLGLYLCRELCEANHASIQYQPTSAGSCFRLLTRTETTS